jgi:hypothetical protein
MDKIDLNRLIVKLLGKSEKQKKELKKIKKIVSDIRLDFIAVSKPLNDNVLKFNKEQLKWCQGIYDKLEEIKLK